MCSENKDVDQQLLHNYISLPLFSMMQVDGFVTWMLINNDFTGK